MGVAHYENFPVASVVLPPALRRPVQILYRFAREADDLADEGDASPPQRLAALEAFGDELRRIERNERPLTPLFEDLSDVVRTHRLPLPLLHDLLDAFRQDVTQTRYRDFAELLDYCRRSANPVGRLLLHLYDATTPENLRRSDAICSSLQLINFLQDVAIDQRKGRIYLPQDELQRFAIDESRIARGEASEPWRRFMQFQIERTRQFLREGAPLGRTLRGRIGLELRLIIAGGDRILEKLDRIGGDVFHRRPVLGAADWPLLLLRALTR